MRRASTILVAMLCCVRAASAAPADAWLVPAFERTDGDRQHLWMSEGVAILLTDALRSSGVPVLSQAERSRLWELRGFASAGVPTHASLITVARTVGAAQVVVGTFAVEGDVLTVSARLLAVVQPSFSAVLDERGPLTELAAIVGRLAGRLAPAAEKAAATSPSMPPAAIERLAKALMSSSAVSRIALVEQALTIAPAMHQARLVAWEVQNSRGQHWSALSQVRRVAAGSPESRRAQFLAAVSLTSLGRLDEAFTEFMTLNRLRRDAAVLNNLGVVQMRRRQPAEALLSDALAEDAADPDIHFNRGYAAWLRGDPRTAVSALSEAVRLRVSDGEAHYVLGHALAAMGKTVEAAYERAIAGRLSARLSTLAPAAARGWERMKLDVDGSGPSRMERLTAASEQHAQQTLARDYLDSGRRLQREGQMTEAIEQLRRAVHLAPYDSEAHRRIAEVHLAAGRAKEAVEAGTLAVFSHDDPALRLLLAEALLGTGQCAAARAEIDRVLTLVPGSADARRLMALQETC